MDVRTAVEEAILSQLQTISLYVNDQLVHQLTDTAYTSGTIALDAGTFVQPSAEVAFDNVVVRRP